MEQLMKAKSKSALNATKHGAYARALRLPWESADELAELYSGLCNDLQPDGVLETEMVNGIHSLIWQRRRVMCAIQLVYYRAPISREIRRSGRKTPVGLQKFLTSRAKEH